MEFYSIWGNGIRINFNLGMIPLTYLILNIVHALWHWYLIKRGRTIFSNQKTIEYSIISILAAVILKLVSGCPVLPLILFAVLTRVAFFDIALNLFRGKNWLYEGEIKSKKSLTDWIESKTELPILAFRVAYIIIYVAYLIFYIT